jgi:3-hydroxyacyl-CoA dehydrogenase
MVILGTVGLSVHHTVRPDLEPIIPRPAIGCKAETVVRNRALECHIVSRILVEGIRRVLEKSIAQRPSDIDICYVTGYGFPKWRGGPMYYADMVGLGNVYEDIERFHAKHGYWWEPAPLLKQLAKDGKRFADLQGGSKGW